MSDDGPKKPPLSEAPESPSGLQPTWQPSEIELDSEGKLHSKKKAGVAKHVNVSSGLEFVRTPKAKTFEPVAHAVPVEHISTVAPPPSFWTRAKTILAIVLLAAIGTGLFVIWKTGAYPSRENQSVGILSEPSGATVVIEGVEVGQTPLFIDNTWGEGDVFFEVKKKGYQTSSGSFPGRREARREVTLRRR